MARSGFLRQSCLAEMKNIKANMTNKTAVIIVRIFTVVGLASPNRIVGKGYQVSVKRQDLEGLTGRIVLHSLWPLEEGCRMSFVYKNNELCCGTVPLKEITAKVGTPTYVYDLEQIEERYKSFDAALKMPHQICFAIKANANLSVLRFLHERGAGFDIVSGGELFKVLRATNNAAANKTVFSGVGKSVKEIREALKSGIFFIAAESSEEVAAIETVAKELNIPAQLTLRINPKIDPQTHPYISTGISESKFGISPSEGLELFARYQKSTHLKIRAISFHIGSQIVSLDPFAQLCQFAKEYVAELRSQGNTITHVDVGGGVGVQYDDEKPIVIEEYATLLNKTFSDLQATVICEPGRWLVGPTGALLATVLYHKENGKKKFRILDAGMGDLIRPALYEAYHRIVPLQSTQLQGDALTSSVAIAQNPQAKTLEWVGPICESGDFIAPSRASLDVQPCGQVAVLTAGAYGFVMASHYNARPLAAEVAVYKGKWQVVRERQTYEDLVRHDKIISL